MEGSFSKNKVTSLWNVIAFISGFAIIVLYLILQIGSESVLEQIFLNMLPSVAVGVAVMAISLASMLFNRKAFLTVDDTSIKAKFGWKNSLNAEIKDVTNVSVGAALEIEVGGKLYSVFGLSNAFQIYEFIRNRLPVDKSLYNDVEGARGEIKKLKDEYILHLCFAVSGLVIMIVLIGVAVLLTGAKDISLMNMREKIILLVFAVMFTAMMALSLLTANVAGKKRRASRRLVEKLRSAVIFGTPLNSGNVESVYTDPYHGGRFTVYVKGKGKYYTLESIDDNYVLATTFTSEIFTEHEKINMLIEEFGLLNITKELI